MTELTGKEEIRQLSDDYFNLRINREEYRQRRKRILDRIDEEMNGICAVEIEDAGGSSLLDKAFAFIKGDKARES